ncbi:MAG TPA: ATP synthase delta/epsilon chain alpha-helix domain-containing protein [Acidimicrobiales bacterium]
MADESLFQINLVTPERILLDGMASEVILRTGEGDVTFLAGHTPLVGTVRPGVVRVVRPEGDDVRIAVHGGFTQVEQNVAVDGDEGTTGSRVTLLVGVAELAEEIDVDRARVALEAAEARVAELGGTANRTPAEGEEADPELVEAEAAVLRAQVRLEAVDATATSAA